MMSDLELLNSSEEDLEWFQENSKQIRKDYGKKIVAIKDKKIIASALSVSLLLKSLSEMKIDSSEVLIESITPENEIVIL